MSEPVIVLDHLSKSYGDVHAVQELSLTIETGTIFGFVGPNGAGKTTTMRMLCGLTHPTGGDATIEGLHVWIERQRVRTKFFVIVTVFGPVMMILFTVVPGLILRFAVPSPQIF